MASKSKKRRRVLGASCILAALIIAGSSFAWFTSKDEVTNRLTASSDYGVSIVESFVPPKNMLPGQTVNKDVYAVNTGSIGAYVKETLRGVLNYTYEQRVTEAPNGNAEHDKDYVELNANIVKAINNGGKMVDGATSQEAGAFLAWTDAKVVGSTDYSTNDKVSLTMTALGDNKKTVGGTDYNYKFAYKDGDVTKYYYSETLDPDSALYSFDNDDTPTTATDTSKTLVVTDNMVPAITAGNVNSARIEDYNQSQGNTPIDNPGKVEDDRWHPTVTGTYIFKRSIKTMDDNGDPLLEPTYKYAGYYYVASTATDDLDTPDVDESEGKYYKISIGDDPFRAAEETETDSDGSTHFVFDITVDQDKLGANVQVDPETGALTGNVPVQYLKDKKVVNATPDLTYHNAGGDSGVAYIEATYSDKYASAEFQQKKQALADAEADLDAARIAYYDALGTMSDDEIAYEDALGALNSAQSRRDQVKADYEYALALENATNALYAAAQTRAQAEIDSMAAQEALEKAFDEMMDEVYKLNADPDTDTSALGTPSDNTNTNMFGDIYGTTATVSGTTGGLYQGDASPISFKSIFGTNKENIADVTIDGDGTPDLTTASDKNKLDYILRGAWGTTENQHLMTNVLNYRTELKNKWDAIQTQIPELKKAMQDFYTATPNPALDPNRTDGKKDPEEAEKMRKKVLEEQAKLLSLLTDYETLYHGLQGAVNNLAHDAAAVSDIHLTNLAALAAAADTIDDQITAWKNHVAALETAINRVGQTDDGTTWNPARGLKELIEAYAQAYKDNNDQLNDNLENAKKNWKTAVEKYNEDVAKAQSDYYDAIYTNQITTDKNGKFAKNDYEGLVAPKDGAANADGGKINTADDDHYNSGYVDKYTGDDKKVVRYLTNNNSAIVKVYAAEKNNEAGTFADGKHGGEADPKITFTEDGWKNLGTLISDATIIAPKGTTQAATWTTSTTTPTYTYLPAVNAHGETVGTYTPATNGIAIVGKDNFKEIRPNTTEQYSSHAAATEARTRSALQSDVDSAQAALDAAEAAYDATKADLDAKKDAFDKADTAQQNADAVVTDALAEEDESKISFWILLDDPETTLNWTPALYDTQTSENGINPEVSFFYNYILEPGTTSDKLVDAIKFSPTVKSKDYKELTFDLNVTLESAQITYANDQRTITADAVDGVDGWIALDKEQGVNGIEQAEGGRVYWKNSTAPEKTLRYYVGNTLVTPDNNSGNGYDLNKVGAAETTKFYYKVTVDSAEYYTDTDSKSGTYYKKDNSGKIDMTDSIVVKEVEVGESTTSDKKDPKAAYAYKLGGSDATVTQVKKVIGDKTYTYKATAGGKTYYGTNDADGSEFFEYTAGDPGTLATDATKLAVTQTVYKLGDVQIKASDITAFGPTEILNTDISNTAVNYTKQVALNGKTYVGANDNNGTAFYAYDSVNNEVNAADSRVLTIETTNSSVTP